MEARVSDNVVKLVESSENAAHWGVKDMLETALRDDGLDRSYRKGLVILLDDQGGAYHVRCLNARLRCSEVTALCEYVKADHVRDMLGGGN